jgi:uncharacterized protein YfiM (DUF2279 family)
VNSRGLFVLMFLLLPAAAQACGPYVDSWSGEDKAKHFGVSAALGVATSQLTADTWSAFGLALIPGVAKEAYDSQQACNRFSWKDLSWDAVGAYVGVRTGHWLISPTGVSYSKEF